MIFHLVFLSLLGAPRQAAAPAPSTDLRARLAAYERLAAEGHQDPGELASIATAVIEQARRAPTFLVWSEACASTAVPDGDRCGPRLWAVLKDPNQPTGTRAEAASALMSRGDAGAADTLADMLKSARPSTLAPLAGIIGVMPSKLAVPLLVRLSSSASPTEQTTACEALSAFDTSDARGAITKVVNANAPGTPPWLACMIARARLHDATPPGALMGYGNTLQGEGLIYASRVALELGDDGPIQLLTDLTHRGSVDARLEAATLLVAKNPEAAIPVIEASEASTDPAVRAGALAAERQLKRPPSKTVRSMLADSAGVVRVRAAEIAIEWQKRAQNR